MKKKSFNPWWYIAVVFAFAGTISLFHIDSAIADEKNLNTVFLVGGIACILFAGYALYRVATDGSTPKD